MKFSKDKILKKISAVLLSASMVVGQGVTAIPAFAAVNELENNENLMDGRFRVDYQNRHFYETTGRTQWKNMSFGHTDSSAYFFGHNTDTSTTQSEQQYSFNFYALKRAINNEPQNAEEEGAYISFNDGLKTVYSTASWAYNYAFGKPEDVSPKVLQMNSNNVYIDKATTAEDDESGQRVWTMIPYRPVAHTDSGTSEPKLKNGEVKIIKDPADSSVEVELKTSLKPSTDNKYIILEQVVYNRSNKEVDFNVGANADTQLYNHDGCPTIVTPMTNRGLAPEGLHQIANHPYDKGKYKYTNLDILTYHPDTKVNAGMQKRDGNDPSETKLWAGFYSSHGNNGGINHKEFTFAKSNPRFTNDGGDSAASFSSYFNLKPYERKVARFAISMKTSVYYVNQNYTGSTSNGYISTPCKSIQAAIDEMVSMGTEKAYIYLMSDVDVSQTIKIPKGLDLTIETTDFVLPHNWVDKGVTDNPPIMYPVNSPRMVVKRADGFDGALFELDSAFDRTVGSGVEDNTVLNIGDVIIDGKRSATSYDSLIKANIGTVKLRSGSQLVDNNINSTADSDKKAASAIDIKGNASLDIHYTTIHGNKAYEGSAISFAGKDFKINGSVSIAQNMDKDDKYANVYLAENKVMTVVGDISSSSTSIGVNISDIPATDTERVIAVNGGGSSVEGTFNASQFPSDRDGVIVAAGTGNNRGSVVIKSLNSKINTSYLNDTTGASLKSSKLEPYTAGSDVVIKSDDINEYVIKDVKIEGDTNNNFTVEYAVENGKKVALVKGKVPSYDVSITFIYMINQAIYHFDVQGGNPISDMSEPQKDSGDSTLQMPVATKRDHKFVAWHEFKDNNGNGVYDSGDEDLGVKTAFGTPQVGTKNYFAEWRLDDTQYAFVVKHLNSNNNLPLLFKQTTQRKTVTEALSAATVNVPGYKINTQSVTPKKAGAFDRDSRAFTGVMGNIPVNVFYSYRVDNNVKFKFKIVHKTQAGRVIAENELDRRAEQVVSAKPLDMNADYALLTAEVTQGADPVPDNCVVGILGDENSTLGAFDNDKNFTGYMPNQNVTITYTYQQISEYFVMSKFSDRVDNRVIKMVSKGYNAEQPINQPAPVIYGYLYGSATAEPSNVGTFGSDGSFTGPSMPQQNVRLNYLMARDPAFWKDVEFKLADAPYNKATLQGNTTNKFLYDDGSDAAVGEAFTFAKFDELDMIPKVEVQEQPFYVFDGWYLDSAGTRKVSDTQTFKNEDLVNGKLTLYAKIVEDPAHWIDISFASGEHGSIEGAQSLHTKNTNTWADISAEIPRTRPIANYIFDKWTVNGETVNNDTALTNAATYVANFKKDPNVWGENVGGISANGKLDFDGGGLIDVNGVNGGNVYIVTDMDGNIIDVIKAPDDSKITFKDLYPGTRYNVYEGTPDTVATPGTNISTATGTSISDPQEVLIPVVEDNYHIGQDPDDEDKVTLVINPADPDSDYALIDENGNVVPVEGSPDGWKTPIGSEPATVTFTGLNPGEKYTIVARKKGDSSKTPLDKLPDGTEKVANPGDDFEVKKYIVETKNGTIVNVGDTTVDANKFTEAHDRDVVEVSAPLTDADNNKFLYWKVMVGKSDDINGRVNQNEFSFKITKSNIVLKAVYENAGGLELTEEVVGGAQSDFAINPEKYNDIKSALETDVDRSLMEVNDADVLYKVIFNKRNANGNEKNLVKDISTAGTEHIDAFTTAWALDIKAERYVNGRKVDRATPSEAEVETYVQLNEHDVEMLDYELFDITDNTAVTMEQLSDNPEDTAGMFVFTGKVGHTYVLVYSRTFKLKFIDDNPLKNHRHLNTGAFSKIIKVRKGESVEDPEYNQDYTDVTAYAQGPNANNLETPFEDIYGVEYNYVNWSKKDYPAKISEFDTSLPVNKTTVVYAYYENNRPLVKQARIDLEDLVEEATEFLDDPYLRAGKADELKEEIDRCKDVLSWKYPDQPRMANYAELKGAYDVLRQILDRLKRETEDRKNRHQSSGRGSSGGGIGSSGQGNGSQKRAFEGTPEKTFWLGVDGDWQYDELTKKWNFVLYGGVKLSDRWGKIQYYNEKGEQVIDWYFFNYRGDMIVGWYYDQMHDKWYYLNTEPAKKEGKMLTGWFVDVDKYVYYLDPVLGEMYTGWRMIGDKWYYFAPQRLEGHPRGSLFVNTITPDGYRVNERGEWVIN